MGEVRLMDVNDDTHCKVREAAQVLDCSDSRIYQHIARGDIEAVNIRRANGRPRLRINRRSLAKFAAQVRR